MDSTVSLEELSSVISSRRNDQRIIVAVAGPPGSGKSTSAELLQSLLIDKQGLTVQIVPMDGFHYDNAILGQLGLSARKGAPETFDVAGLESILKRLAAAFQVADVAIPTFDRDNDLSRGSARLIDKETAVLLVEGNYLLMHDAPWAGLAPYFDLTAMIACDEDELRLRLMKRWLDLDYSEAEASEKVEGNDLRNARLVIKQSNQADYTLINSSN